MENKSGRLLVVDDSRMNRLKLSRALEQQGHTFALAEGGAEALALVEDQPFDLILLDLLMPGMDGYQVLAHLKDDERWRDIPVVVISALDDLDSVVKAIELGAEDHLPKPFDPVLLKARIGACLEKKRLRDQEQLYLKGLERELEIGRKIQADFLPDELPQPAGWEIAAYFRSAREVAGDFYDAFPLAGEKNIGLVIGDVCDKGVGAALYMALFRSLIRAMSDLDHFTGGAIPLTAPSEPSPGPDQARPDGAARLKNAVTLTNNYVTRIHGQADQFTTLFFGLLDPATGALIYINGGHEPPLILDSTGVKARLRATGPVVGILPAIDFKVGQTRLEPGDILLSFTDGVTDVLNPEGKAFTKEKLLSLLEQPAPSAAALLDRIEAALQGHMADTNQYDDITILAVRRGWNG